MQMSEFTQRTLSLGVVLIALLTAVPARAADEAAALQNAIKLFDAGDYLAAQEMILALDRSKLDKEQQALRDDYVDRIQTALLMTQKALDDLEDAELAVHEGDKEHARASLNAVLSNQYAPEPVRKTAQAHLEDLEAAAAPPPAEPAPSTEAPPAQPAPPAPVAGEPPSGGAESDMQRARVLCAEAEAMIPAARYDEAERLYQEALALVPGYPDAVNGLQRVAQHRENVAGSRSESLIAVMNRQDAINWQRAETEYRTVEQRVRELVGRQQFDEAHQLVLRARQIVESNRQFAQPVAKYEQLRAEADALEKFVRDEERAYNEKQVSEIRRQIAAQRTARIREIEDNKRRQVDALMKQARQHYKDGDLESAISVLQQVLVIDPQYDTARWLMDSWDDLNQFREARRIRDEQYIQTRRALIDVERDKIPWWERLQYPKNWLEIISRPTRSRPGETRADTLLSSTLQTPITVDFQEMPFQQVIERFAGAHRLNIIVNWADLKTAGVSPAAPITLNLPQEITLQRALTEVLSQAGAGTADLGYNIRDGQLAIATRAHLDRQTYTAAYDVQDLLMEVPDFGDAPTVTVGDKLRREQIAGLYGRRERSHVFGDDDDDESDRDPRVQRRVAALIDMIETHVAPESWPERGGSVGAITEINGQLIITQNSAGHERISGLLEKLREQQAIQVAVEARFLTVSSNYLEELGLDLDLYLNQGNAGYDLIATGIPESPIATDPVLGSNLLLPRSFSRVGFGPTVPNQGTAFTSAGGQAFNLAQPYQNPVLVPGRTGGAINMGQATPVPVTSSVLDFTDPSTLNSDVPGTFAGRSVGPALSVFGSFLDNIQVDFLIRATQADSRTTVLTAPHLVLSNGQTAWVAVQTQTYFVSQLIPQVNVGAAAQAPQTSSVPTGAVLTVQATVSADKRYVKMNLTPGISRLLSLNTFTTNIGGTAGTGFVQIPEISTTQVNTTVTIPDGGTLLVGGQKLASEIEVEAGVPILSKIPILKRAYSSRAMAKDEQTLLILVKPQILIQPEQEEIAFPTFKHAGS